MDDIYFSDRKNNNRNKSNSRDHFTNETPISPKGNLRDEQAAVGNRYPGGQGSRTPKGKPLYGNEPERSFDYKSEAPTYKSVPRDVYSQNVSSQGGNASNNAPRSRTPQGKKVGETKQRSVPEARMPSRPSNAYRPSTQGSRPAPSKKSPPSRKKGKKSKAKIAAISIISIILVVFVGLFAYGYTALGKIDYKTNEIKKNQYISDKNLAKSASVRNILLIGSDARSDVGGQRSDTMILCSIDKKNKKLKLTSFLRDSYVTIPSKNYMNKLNASFSFGGTQLARDTLEYNFKVKIDNFVVVDFEAFTKFVDLMGGLTVDGVTKEEAKYLRDKVKIVYAKEGKNKFSGAATLWYCRIRYTSYYDNDFRRTERQRKVISAMISQIAKTNPVKLMNIMQKVLPMISTDISRNELVSLGAGALTSYIHYDIAQHKIPADGTWQNASIRGIGDVLKMDIDKNAQLLKSFIYEKDKKKAE